MKKLLHLILILAGIASSLLIQGAEFSAQASSLAKTAGEAASQKALTEEQESQRKLEQKKEEIKATWENRAQQRALEFEQRLKQRALQALQESTERAKKASEEWHKTAAKIGSSEAAQKAGTEEAIEDRPLGLNAETLQHLFTVQITRSKTCWEAGSKLRSLIQSIRPTSRYFARSVDTDYLVTQISKHFKIDPLLASVALGLPKGFDEAILKYENLNDNSKESVFYGSTFQTALRAGLKFFKFPKNIRPPLTYEDEAVILFAQYVIANAEKYPKTKAFLQEQEARKSMLQQYLFDPDRYLNQN